MPDYQDVMQSLEDLAEKTPKILTDAVRVIDELYEQTVRDEHAIGKKNNEMCILKDQLSIAVATLMAVPFAWSKKDIKKSAMEALANIRNMEV